ncbi:MAG: hypothetical protein EPN70_15570 [Paraburkholderia sp.]|uniref:hypothetical protein n=1 Tax=Paraburkholderia sp. TaxID=1926495 RepID=UPI00121D0C5D|nr:hypothetical protein [Paraburkholderia sp.]TAM02938.1 MAG: hypothetical protein EPN70_15570 [Paraburkholderia sp.]TAM29342.1 MAG: hypothetical protein EPN59_12740 [Paraburkholderia sp.]
MTRIAGRRRASGKKHTGDTHANPSTREPGPRAARSCTRARCLYRGVLITPFHNMMLVCPDTTAADIDRLLEAFDACVGELT